MIGLWQRGKVFSAAVSLQAAIREGHTLGAAPYQQGAFLKNAFEKLLQLKVTVAPHLGQHS